MGMRVIYVMKLLSPRSEVKAHLQTQTQCKPVSPSERGEGLCTWNMAGLMGPWPKLQNEGISLEGSITRDRITGFND